MHSDGDNNFSDEDGLFDDPDLLVNLESQAIQSTQRPALTKGPPSSDYGDFDEEDLDDAVIIDEAKCPPSYVHSNVGQDLPSALPKVGQASPQEQFRQERYGLSGRPRSSPSINPPSKHKPKPPPPLFAQNDPIPVRQSQPAADATADALKQALLQVEELIRTNNVLNQENNTKKGEISMLRSGQEKSRKEGERQQAAQAKLHAEHVAKLEKEAEEAKIVAQKVVTESEFTRRDLAEESERVRRLNKRTTTNGLPTTPRKKKSLLQGDGFDGDVELRTITSPQVSPSKFEKRPHVSPSKSKGKRKRKAQDSPVAGLQLLPAEDSVPGFQKEKSTFLDQSLIERLAVPDDRFDFIGAMLDRRPRLDHQRSIQELSKHALPSAPTETFESIILGRVSSIGAQTPPSDLPVEFCKLLVDMWSRCIDENYYSPLYLIIDLLTYALELKTSLLAPQIIDSLLPVLQNTAMLVLEPRFNRDWSKLKPLIDDIDVTSCLALLHLAALGCTSDTNQLIRFCSLMQWKLVLTVLSMSQPIEQFEYMVQILSTLVLKDCIGFTNPVAAVVDNYNRHMLARLTGPLYTTLYTPEEPEKADQETVQVKHDPETVLRLRIKIVKLLTNMTRFQYGGSIIAGHQFAIGRIVGLANSELDSLYDYTSNYENSALLISLATRLLYNITQLHDVEINRKLEILPGGSQKYLYLMSRLAMAETDLLFEAGIDEDIAHLATEMLETRLTAEEGEAITLAFTGVSSAAL